VSSTPNGCCQRKQHVWGAGQRHWQFSAFVVCGLNLFVLAVTSQDFDPRSVVDMETVGASAVNGRKP
jgi:hypothetical protein